MEVCCIVFDIDGRWFLQIPVVDRDSWNLYPLFPCSDFVSQMWGWFGGGGGVCNVFLQIGNIEKCLFTYWLNGGDGFSKS